MSLVTAAGFVVVLLLVGALAAWIDPAIVERLGRETGLDARGGWAAYAVACVLVALPLALGGTLGEGRGIGPGEGWIVGSALAGLGVYLIVIAATSYDEYAALSASRPLAEAGDGTAVRASGTPDADRNVTAPSSGTESVHVDWLVQVRRRAGIRTTWQNGATGVSKTPFTVGTGAERVRVVPGERRAFTPETTVRTVGPDETLRAGERALLAADADLPDPDDRDRPVRFVTSYVPSDDPVTVVGLPERYGDGVEIRVGPPEGPFGTDGADPPPVLIAGDEPDARRQVTKRVRWVGGAGAAFVVGGELLAVLLSPATLPVVGL